MASGNDRVASDGETRWYCHSCDCETTPSMPEYVCSTCSNGFIEPIVEECHETDSGTSRLQFNGAANNVQFNSWPGTPAGNGRRRAHITIHRMQPGGPNPFQDFLNQFIGSLNAGNAHQGPINIQFAPTTGQNMGDYVFTAGGLDNVITMLLNQLDGAGPPPAHKDQIDALPIVTISQEQIDGNLQCNVCMEDYQLNEPVRGLPCKHVFHADCIVPWLQLHGTCPICRKALDVRPSRTNDILPD